MEEQKKWFLLLLFLFSFILATTTPPTPTQSEGDIVFSMTQREVLTSYKKTK